MSWGQETKSGMWPSCHQLKNYIHQCTVHRKKPRTLSGFLATPRKTNTDGRCATSLPKLDARGQIRAFFIHASHLRRRAKMYLWKEHCACHPPMRSTSLQETREPQNPGRQVDWKYIDLATNLFLAYPTHKRRSQSNCVCLVKWKVCSRKFRLGYDDLEDWEPHRSWVRGKFFCVLGWWLIVKVKANFRRRAGAFGSSCYLDVR